MSSLNEKLKLFNEVILKDAALERNKILDQIRTEVKERICLEKRKYQEQADEFFNREVASIENEKNNIVSRAVIESRQLLMKTREDIMKAVFSDIRKLLCDFVLGAEYFSYLCSQIRKSCSLAGDGELVVYVTKSDMERFSAGLDSLKRELPMCSIMKRTDEDIIGGCMVLNTTEDVMVNNTLLEKLEANMDSFFVGLGQYGNFII